MDISEKPFKISPSSSPESVFSQLIADLESPIKDIKSLLMALSQPVEASKKLETLAKMEIAAANAEWYLSSAIDYVTERKTFSQSEDKQTVNQLSRRDELAEGTITLFASVMPVEDIRFYSKVCQQNSLPEDEQAQVLAILNSNGNTIVNTYTHVRDNWRTMFEEQLSRDEKPE